jgi:hypothetical protein
MIHLSPMRQLLALLPFVCVSGLSWAQTCQPYAIPASTIACGQGFAGTQSTWTTKTCPDGIVTTSARYDTSRCLPIVTVGTGAGAYQTVAGRRYTPPISDCITYSRPTPGTETACVGQPTRLRWKLTTKHCPSGLVTNSTDYDTSACGLPNTTPSCDNQGTTTNQDSSCTAAGAAPGCPSGQEWRIVKPGDLAPGFAVGTAHCVVPASVLPLCNSGGANGAMLSCALLYPSRPFGVAFTRIYNTYNGSSNCIPTPTSGYNSNCFAQCIPGTTQTADSAVACGTGMTGTKFTTTTRTTTCVGNRPSVSTSTSDYNTAACTTRPPIVNNCNTGVANGTAVSCTSAGLPGQVGTAYALVYTAHRLRFVCTTVAAPGYDTSGCTPACTPSSTQQANPPVACGTGMTGTKFTTTTTTVSCPSNLSSVSTSDYNTSACATPTPPPIPATPNCIPGTTQTADSAVACGTGMTGTKFTTTTRTTTCVGNRPSVSTSTSDYNTAACTTRPPIVNNCNTGVANGTAVSCTSAGLPGQVGTAYALVYTAHRLRFVCTTVAAPGYDTSGCTPACTPSSTQQANPPVACGTGMTGTKFTTTTTTVSCPSNLSSVSTSDYNTSACATPTPPPIPATPNCNTGSANGTALSCTSAGLAGQVGTAFTLVYTAHNTGAVCTTVAAPGYNTSGCTVACTPRSTQRANPPVACGTGFTGTKFTTTTTNYTCPGNVPSETTSGYNTSACGCLGGGSYPTCATNNTPPNSCPEDRDFCNHQLAQGGSEILTWGRVTYGPAPACAVRSKTVGGGRFPGNADCPGIYESAGQRPR